MDTTTQEILAALRPRDELAGLSSEQLQAGIARVVKFGLDDEAMAADDARQAEEAKAARRAGGLRGI
jgi:hypothetical protein